MRSIRLMFIVIVAALSVVTINGIPDDVEVLEGFEIEPLASNVDVGDQKHLITQFLIKAIRNRRSPYKIMESEGLRSHFKRTRRSTEESKAEDRIEPTEESLPTAEKFMGNGYYPDEWAKYSKDSVPEASALNEGIKARAPRVNFITQNQNREAKNLDVAESRDTRTNSLPDTTTAPDYYRKNMARIYLDYPRPFDSYPRPYEPAYERNMIDRPVYPEFYDPRRQGYEDYDSYMPRTLSYPNYYYYPDKRYDVPEPREPYIPAYVPQTIPNEIPPLSPANRNRRIIYYTTLPEVVRTPPNVNLNYQVGYKQRTPYPDPYERYYQPYYNYYYNGGYNPQLQTPVPPQHVQQQGPPATAASYNHPQVALAAADAYRSNRSPRDYVRPGISSITQITNSRTPTKVINSKSTRSDNSNTNTNNNNNNQNTNNNSTPDRRIFTEVKDDRPSYQDGAEEREHPYFSRHH